MQPKGLYKEMKPLQIGGWEIERKQRNCVGKPCIWKLELNTNIGSSAKSEEVLIPYLILCEWFVELISSQK